MMSSAVSTESRSATRRLAWRNCMLAIVAFMVRQMQIIGLVDEKHAAHRLLQDLLGLGRGVADILPDQLIAGDGDDLTTAHETELVQNARDPQRHGGLSGTGIA